MKVSPFKVSEFFIMSYLNTYYSYLLFTMYYFIQKQYDNISLINTYYFRSRTGIKPPEGKSTTVTKNTETLLFVKYTKVVVLSFKYVLS